MSSDIAYMQLAIEEGEKARYHAPPNPWVGCILVKEGAIVGRGHSQPPGKNHAEVEAILQAGELARGSTAYVTLEPCSHFGKTPPCADLLIQSGVAKVVVAIEDPDARVQGNGISRLKEAGILVDVGLGADEVKRSFRSYIHHRKLGRPFCIAKAAMSIDGRTSAADGSSQWITTREARQDVHHLRDLSQGVMVGSGTALRDLPSLTVRDIKRQSLKNPLRILLDSRGRVPAQGPLFHHIDTAPTLIFTTDLAPAGRVLEWEIAGAEVIVVPLGNSQHLSLGHVMQELGKRGILQLLVEGGRKLLGGLWQERLIDLFSVYIGPKLLGTKGLPLLDIPGPDTIANAPKLRLTSMKQLGESARLDYTCHLESGEL